MKSFTLILLLTLVALFSFHHVAAARVQAPRAQPMLDAWALRDRQVCDRKYGDALDAINQLCGNKNLVVPGNLADRGVNKNGVFVKIAGPCNPAQWVPQKYCYKQFYNMCANKVKEGNFGRNGCQKFGIYNVNGW